jgi:hypothetical protein
MGINRIAASLPTLWTFSILPLTTLILYLTGLIVYRLYLSPLSEFPGPKLAALSNWYEFYYDVVLHGKFTFQIQKLHQQFGTGKKLFN